MSDYLLKIKFAHLGNLMKVLQYHFSGQSNLGFQNTMQKHRQIFFDNKVHAFCQ